MDPRISASTQQRPVVTAEPVTPGDNAGATSVGQAGNTGEMAPVSPELAIPTRQETASETQNPSATRDSSRAVALAMKTIELFGKGLGLLARAFKEQPLVTTALSSTAGAVVCGALSLLIPPMWPVAVGFAGVAAVSWTALAATSN